MQIEDSSEFATCALTYVAAASKFIFANYNWIYGLLKKRAFGKWKTKMSAPNGKFVFCFYLASFSKFSKDGKGDVRISQRSKNLGQVSS